MKRLITVILALQLLLIPSLHNARAEAEYPPLPFPAELVQAVFENYTPDEEKGLISVLYSGATHDDLLYYQSLCASLGMYACPMESEEDELSTSVLNIMTHSFFEHHNSIFHYTTIKVFFEFSLIFFNLYSISSHKVSKRTFFVKKRLLNLT